MVRLPLRDGRIHYKCKIPADTIKAYQEIEQTRQALIHGEANEKTLAYARFLNAVESDATISHGSFKPFQHDDEEVARQWPFLANMLERSAQ